MGRERRRRKLFANWGKDTLFAAVFSCSLFQASVPTDFETQSVRSPSISRKRSVTNVLSLGFQDKKSLLTWTVIFVTVNVLLSRFSKSRNPWQNGHRFKLWGEQQVDSRKRKWRKCLFSEDSRQERSREGKDQGWSDKGSFETGRADIHEWYSRGSKEPWRRSFLEVCILSNLWRRRDLRWRNLTSSVNCLNLFLNKNDNCFR